MFCYPLVLLNTDVIIGTEANLGTSTLRGAAKHRRVKIVSSRVGIPIVKLLLKYRLSENLVTAFRAR